MNEAEKFKFEMLSTEKLAEECRLSKAIEKNKRKLRQEALRYEDTQSAEKYLPEIRYWSDKARYLEALLERRQMKLF